MPRWTAITNLYASFTRSAAAILRYTTFQRCLISCKQILFPQPRCPRRSVIKRFLTFYEKRLNLQIQANVYREEVDMMFNQFSVATSDEMLKFDLFGARRMVRLTCDCCADQAVDSGRSFSNQSTNRFIFERDLKTEPSRKGAHL